MLSVATYNQGKLDILIIMWELQASQMAEDGTQHVVVGLIPFGVISLKSFIYI
jgi:hypothetical protein